MAKGQIKQKQSKISKEMFEELCKIQCTEVEVCAVFGVCTDTIDEWCRNNYGKHFSEIAKEKRQAGCSSIRRKQWKVACETENPTMLIWLGKQYLGQTEKVEQENTEKVIFTDDINPEPDR